VATASSTSDSGTTTVRPIQSDILKLIGRGLVVIAFILAIIAFIDTTIIFTGYYTGSIEIETEAGFAAAEFQSYFDEMGISSTTFAWYINVWRVIKVLVFYSVAILIFARRSDSTIGIISTLWFIGMGASVTNVVSLNEVGLIAAYPHWNALPGIFTLEFLGQMSVFIVYGLAWILLGPFILTYPNGRIQPKWVWIALILFMTTVFSWVFIPPESPYHPINLTGIANFLVSSVALFPVVFALIVRYRNHLTQIEKQQAKIFIYSSAIYLIIYVFYSVTSSNFGATQPYAQTSIIGDAIGIIVDTGFVALPIAVAIALFRYRLWDIDLVINRSLVYGAILGIAAIVFGGALFGLQLIGSTNLFLAGGLSVLVTGLLYRPARTRVQKFVDHRIYGLRFGLDEVNQLKSESKPSIETTGQLTGEQFGEFELLDLLGKGGMGEVYKAYRQGETLAIKVLNIDMSMDKDMRRRFEREAAAGMKLQHPNIVQVHDMKEEGAFYYMVMEYIDGQDLRQYLKHTDKLDIETATTIIAKLCDALTVAHSQNYVHRDIKPANIMLRSNGDPVLMDFGIAKLRDGRTVITKTGAIGTIDYMAPEQIMEAKEVDARADIYALGVTLYEMLTGERPFKGSPAQVMFAHIQQPAPDIRDLDDSIPRNVVKAIKKALAKKPDERYQSAEEFAGDIQV